MEEEEEEQIKLSLLSRFGNDLWINRRLELNEVCSYLIDTFGNSSGRAADWLRFIRFLESECNGQNFTSQDEKHCWSELLNLMQISRKLNHRSVKFKDIIRNKQVIESNSNSLKRLNEAVKLGQTIESSLSQLESLLLHVNCRLNLPTSSQQEKGEEPVQQFMLQELSETKSYLNTRCKPTLYTLKLELDNELIMENVNLDAWRTRINKCEKLLVEMERFLTGLHELQTALMHLRPLVSIEGKKKAEEGYQHTESSTISNGRQLNQSIATCRKKFREICEFHGKLINSLGALDEQGKRLRGGLKQLASTETTKGFPMIKLFDVRHHDLVSELFGSDLSKALEDVIECRHQLDKIMQTLRMEFGRFYFVNDLELLTIIGLNSSLVTQVDDQLCRQLLCKLFNNAICGFVLEQRIASDDSRPQSVIVGVRSPLGEVILLSSDEEPVPIRKKVNVYSVEIVRILNETIRKVRRTLQSMLTKSLQENPLSSDETIDWSLPVQLIIVAEYVKFTGRVEKHFNNNNKSISLLIHFYEQRFQQLCTHKNQQESATKSWCPLDEYKKSAALSMMVHFISTLMVLGENKVCHLNDWFWQKQVRYYMKPDEKQLEVCIANTKFLYKYDYLTLQANELNQQQVEAAAATYKRLISTQITERCFLVACQAVCNLRFGANPYGPAGSGKTETIKALGSLLGCQVIVHNCDEFNDSKSLDRLIWGLAHTGLWGCFDEFNRLSSSVLSSVSSTLELVQGSIRENKTTVELADGQLMCIDRDSAFFITLNPSGGDTTSKYRGRRRLPANLRSLFLPVSMVRIQIDTIVSESLLTLSGQLNRRWLDLKPSESLKLGQKLSSWMEWMNVQLVSFSGGSGRCEWDLRLVMAILRRLKIIALNLSTSDDSQVIKNPPSIDCLLIDSIKTEIRPRISSNELDIYYKGFEVNFAAQTLGRNTLQTADALSSLEKKRILDWTKARGFIDELELVIDLASQLRNQLETRTGVMLLGSAGTGKSTTWQALQVALGGSVRCLTLNPRSCIGTELFGTVDMESGKWSDGLLTAIVRQALSILEIESSVKQVWVILDGPIDPDWIESLNSVLDDNRVLTLSSGERLDFSRSLNPEKSLKLIFETNDIKFASPATMSRLGLVYHEVDRFKLKHVDKNLLNSQMQSVEHPQSAINNTSLLMQPIEYPQNKQPETGDHCDDIEKRFIASKTNNLLIVIGGSSSIVTNIMREEDSVMQYSCSRFSTSNDLLDLLISVPSDYYIIHNTQLIQAEDRWNSKGFIELLRYVVTYGGFYDGSSSLSNTLKFKMIKSKFIITVKNLDNLDARLISLANVIKPMLPSDHQPSQYEKCTLSSKTDLDQILAKQYTPILTIFGCTHLNQIDLLKQLVNEDQLNIFGFRSSRMASESLKSFEKYLLNLQQHESNSKHKNLFILNDLECNLLDKSILAKLYHRLNWLKMRQPKTLRFIHLSDCIKTNDTQGSNELEFWSVLGGVYQITRHDDDKNDKQSIREKIQIKFFQEISTDLKISKSQMDWLVDKTSSAFLLLMSKRNDMHASQIEHSLNNYSYLIVQLMNQSATSLLFQKNTLSNGLNRLSRFEQNVEKVKKRCKEQETELSEKKREIQRLIQVIDGTLKESQKQREQVENLKHKQEAKTHEIQTRSLKLDVELSKVSKLVESSKSEIAQCLKPEALNEIKTLRSPPKTIKDILDVLFILLGINDSSWTSIKSHLTKNSLKDELTQYDFKKNLNKSLLNRVESQIETKRDSFNPQQAARASKAVVPILGWIQATVEYGRVLIRLRPLSEEMEQLSEEAKELDNTAKRLEMELGQIELRITDDSNRLERLKQDYEESQSSSNEIKSQLTKAQKVRYELDDQINRWKEKLDSIDQLLKDGSLELTKLCLVASSMALYYDSAASNGENQLKDWCDAFELESNLEIEKLLSKLLDLLMNNQSTGIECQEQQVRFKIEETNRIVQLLIIRLCLNANNRNLVPFLDLGGVYSGMMDTNLLQYLQFKSILYSSGSNVNSGLALIICAQEQQQSMNWIQSVELALKLDKIVLLKLPDETSSFDLDIMDLVLTRPNGAKILLVGQLDKHETIRHLVRSIKLLSSAAITSGSATNTDELRMITIDHLTMTYDPELSESIEKLEQQLQSKQKEAKAMEVNLLRRLAVDTSVEQSMANTTTMDLVQDDLVRFLSNLHELSETLATQVSQMKLKIEKSREKQKDYWQLASEAAEFYCNYLARLNQVDRFYHLPFGKYLDLLCTQQHATVTTTDYSQPIGCQLKLDYELILSRVMRCMRTDSRLDFERNLLQQENQQVSKALLHVTNGVDSSSGSSMQESQLKQALMELIQDSVPVCQHLVEDERKRVETVEAGGQGNDNLRKLMVILHDSAKSSPQVEVDEFFRQQHVACQYIKVYATGDDKESGERLELVLSEMLSSPSPPNSGSDGNICSTKCLCIANAHLSSKWINSRLLQLMEGNTMVSPPRPPLAAAAALTFTRLLVILVAECSVGSSSPSPSPSPSSSETTDDNNNNNIGEQELDSSVLDYARVKYWHDELSLSLVHRFNLLTRSLLAASSFQISQEKRNHQLARQLVLFHVVCQERTTTITHDNNKDRPVGWLKKYCFDYDQLCLALKTLKKLALSSSGTQPGGDDVQLRRMLCHYLEWIVYGARMECEEDERTLKELIERFLGSQESANQQMAKLERLKSNQLSAGEAQNQGKPMAAEYSSRLLAELVGI